VFRSPAHTLGIFSLKKIVGAREAFKAWGAKKKQSTPVAKSKNEQEFGEKQWW